VYVVGVAPTAQGGGLGRRLTLTGLRHLSSLGLHEALLYVEAENAPAVAVYRRLGFTHAPEDTHVQYARAGVDDPT
jgi:mycothiol synthase